MLRNALTDLTVLDFTHIGAGPTCTMLLADMGAKVIKVEPPEGELGRKLGPAWIGKDSALYHGFNRNKLGLSLDLKTTAGVSVAKKLAAQADIVVESMRPGVMERLGLGFTVLAQDNPDLIYCSISAYGQTGPYAQRAGVDGILQADSGLMSIIGTKDGDPVKVQAPIVDVFTGYVAVAGILAQLRKTSTHGRGAQLDVNLFSSAVALQQVSLTNFLAEGAIPERIGSAAPYSAPNEAFEASDGWLMIAAYNGGRWERLCTVIGLPGLADDKRFATSSSRVAHRREMREILGIRLRQESRQHWLGLLHDADILCSPVANYEDLMKHPQLNANGMIQDLIHPELGTIRVPGFPIDSREMAAIPQVSAPGLGEHSREILSSFGFTVREIDQLIDDNVVGAFEETPLRARASEH
ncbi:CoA transferase [Rhizobium leguminosarum]|uniref:CaiB/BaiF CoA transferase family protein n=1 Tax=Rhizobium TaxID=379 RepID=UPI00102FD72A|nr:CoA transferase [Rhizobium leguminosarum]TBF87467.1 CoA transferase [Rhizobium leguminosarum]TBG07022.1 CoA transferase [Rhizobium leguminosarum]TBG07336.1 CoA transferase [Rhizobium leguminosarum]TBG30713.1 CoA transferase [Rhizobium leguminosarum]TBG49706.1 CoA transferase [Rhizobium leguminosarum]